MTGFVPSEHGCTIATTALILHNKRVEVDVNWAKIVDINGNSYLLIRADFCTGLEAREGSAIYILAGVDSKIVGAILTNPGGIEHWAAIRKLFVGLMSN